MVGRFHSQCTTFRMAARPSVVVLNEGCLFQGDRVLSADKCRTWIAQIDHLMARVRQTDPAGFKAANDYTPLRHYTRLETCEDDAHVTLLWQRMRPLLPPVIEHVGQQWRLRGLNAFFRYNRYEPGQTSASKWRCRVAATNARF